MRPPTSQAVSNNGTHPLTDGTDRTTHQTLTLAFRAGSTFDRPRLMAQKRRIAPTITGSTAIAVFAIDEAVELTRLVVVDVASGRVGVVCAKAATGTPT